MLNAIPPGRVRPSGPKLCALIASSYVLSSRHSIHHFSAYLHSYRLGPPAGHESAARLRVLLRLVGQGGRWPTPADHATWATRRPSNSSSRPSAVRGTRHQHHVTSSQGTLSSTGPPATGPGHDFDLPGDGPGTRLGLDGEDAADGDQPVAHVRNLWPVRMASGWQPAPVSSTTNSNPFR